MQDTGVIYKVSIAPQSPSYCICTLMTNSFIVVPHIYLTLPNCFRFMVYGGLYMLNKSVSDEELLICRI